MISPDRSEALLRRYRAIGERSERLCTPLALEDYVPQPIVETSPPKWHLGHTAWFYEALILKHGLKGYREFDPGYAYVFNSYYESLGERVRQQHRGTLSRPTVAQVLAFRAHVHRHMSELLQAGVDDAAAALVEQALQHEQQHQELLLTDIKYILGNNPLSPAYARAGDGAAISTDAEHCAEPETETDWLEWPGGEVEIGHDGEGFAFDNESARHRALVGRAQLRSTLATNAEYLAFIADGGYAKHGLWHADGWDWVRSGRIAAPLYWREADDQPCGWMHYTLRGLEPLLARAPVTHINFYEASAFCAWAGWRLPTEFEWEALAPRIGWGRRWEWTGSAYLPYPGFRATDGAGGEYNGKFMVGQMVLRGASYATPPGHARPTYRNFFHPHQRWQYCGVRPARDRG